MKRADYLAIGFHMAGTFTAIHGVMCRGLWRRWMLTFIGTYAAAALVAQLLWFEQLSGVVGLLLYLILGGMGLATVIKVGRDVGFRVVRTLGFAGIVFSIGAISEALHRPHVVDGWLGPHEVFHFAVIAGAAIHWLFIPGLVLAHAPGNEARAPCATPARCGADERLRFARVEVQDCSSQAPLQATHECTPGLSERNRKSGCAGARAAFLAGQLVESVPRRRV
jgi:hypothetical protein